MYTRLARRLEPSEETVNQIVLFCLARPYTIAIYHQSHPHGRPPSLLPSACRPSVRYSGRALTTLLCPPPQDRTLTDALPAPLTRSGVRGLLAVLGQPLIDSTGCALRVGSTGLTI